MEVNTINITFTKGGIDLDLSCTPIELLGAIDALLSAFEDNFNVPREELLDNFKELPKAESTKISEH